MAAKNLNFLSLSCCDGLQAARRRRVCRDEDSDEDEPEDHEPQWTQLVGGPFTKEDELCVDLRRLQQRCRCSDATCADILSTFSKYLHLNQDLNFRDADQRLHELSGATVLRLNGCPQCQRHVYLPTDKEKNCPICGHDRYGADGKPLEVC